MELVVLPPNAVSRNVWTQFPCGSQDLRQIETRSLPGTETLIDFEHIRSPDHFIDSSEAELCHISAKFFSEIIEEVDDMFRLTGKLCAQLGILCGDANRAGVDYIKITVRTLMKIMEDLASDLR